MLLIRVHVGDCNQKKRTKNGSIEGIEENYTALQIATVAMVTTSGGIRNREGGEIKAILDRVGTF